MILNENGHVFLQELRRAGARIEEHQLLDAMEMAGERLAESRDADFAVIGVFGAMDGSRYEDSLADVEPERPATW